MEITTQTVDKLSNLAQLEFSETEKEAIKSDLNKMIGFIEQLEKLIQLVLNHYYIFLML